MDKDTLHEPSYTVCITCNTELKGDYCYKCGEKKIIPAKDYSLIGFIEDAFEGLMHLDSKVIKTFWLLISRPGLLAMEYNRGRRKPYMKPIQLFLVATLLFYFVFPPSYLFFAKIENMQTAYRNNAIGANTYHYDIGHKIEKIAAQKGLTIDQVIEEIEKEAFHKSKEYLFVILPFFALMFYVLFRKANKYYVPHLIVAAYLFSFFIIANLVAISCIEWVFRITDVTDAYFEIIIIVFFTYLLLSVKRVYQQSWIKSIFKSAILLVWFAILILAYRQLITISAVNAI